MRILTRLPSRNNHPLPAAIQRVEPALSALRWLGLGLAAFVWFSLLLIAFQGTPTPLSLP